MRSHDLNKFSVAHKYIKKIKFDYIDTGRYRLKFKNKRALSTSTLTNSLCRLVQADEFAIGNKINREKVLKHLNTVLLDAKRINELNNQIRDTQAQRSGPKLFLRKIFKSRTLTEDQIIDKIKRSYEIGINNAIRDIQRNRHKEDAGKNQITEELDSLKMEIFQAIDKRNEEKPKSSPLQIPEPSPKYMPPPKSRSKSKESSHEDHPPQNRSRSTSTSSEEQPKTEPAPKPETIPQVVPSSKSSSKSSSEEQPKAEPAPEPEAVPQAVPSSKSSSKSSSEEQPKTEPAPEPETIPQAVSSSKSSSKSSSEEQPKAEPEAVPQVVSLSKGSLKSKSSSSEEEAPSLVENEYLRPASPTKYEDDLLPPDTRSFSSSEEDPELPELVEEKPSPPVVTKKNWWEVNVTASFFKLVQPLQNLVQNALKPKTPAPTPSPSVIASETSTQRNSLSDSEEDHLFQSLENSETESQPEPIQEIAAVQAEEAPPLPSLHPVSMSKNSSIPLSREKQSSNPTPETKVQPEPSPEMPAVQGKKAPPPPPPPPPVRTPKQTLTPTKAKQQPMPTTARPAPPDTKDLSKMKTRLKKPPERNPAERLTPTQPRDALLAEIQKKGPGSLKKMVPSETPATKNTANLSAPTNQRNALLADIQKKGPGSLKKIEITKQDKPVDNGLTNTLKERFEKLRPQLEDSSSEETSEEDWN